MFAFNSDSIIKDSHDAHKVSLEINGAVPIISTETIYSINTNLNYDFAKHSISLGLFYWPLYLDGGLNLQYRYFPNSKLSTLKPYFITSFEYVEFSGAQKGDLLLFTGYGFTLNLGKKIYLNEVNLLGTSGGVLTNIGNNNPDPLVNPMYFTDHINYQFKLGIGYRF